MEPQRVREAESGISIFRADRALGTILMVPGSVYLQAEVVFLPRNRLLEVEHDPPIL